jgi:DNA-binding response OmpR family regulator
MSKKILYVDDNKDIAEAVKIILNNAGHEIDIVFNGKECLEKSKEGYDLFLLDIMLPDMSGWDIFIELKKTNINSKYSLISAIPVSNERLDELKKMGISDYIMKPFSKTDLIERINRIIENGHL